MAISDLCHHMNMIGVQYKQFQCIALKVLPEIGSSIRLLVFNGFWQTTMSKQIRSILFSSDLSVVFTQLHTWILIYFTNEHLFTFPDTNKNLVQLVKLDIRSFEGKHLKELLRKVLATNDGQQQSISFDQHFIDLDLTEAQHDQPISYLNVEELTINLLKYN
ncbi:unnamed protein product [Rotaria sp. Silwood1]|nr:unnamed protein product [Rotaria sp. Silwood1]